MVVVLEADLRPCVPRWELLDVRHKWDFKSAELDGRVPVLVGKFGECGGACVASNASRTSLRRRIFGLTDADLASLCIGVVPLSISCQYIWRQ